MNKTNDLIEKANARARSQNQGRPTPGTSTQLARARQDDEEEKPSYSQRRIRAGGGRVVVRRRSRGNTEERQPKAEAQAPQKAAPPPKVAPVVAEAPQAAAPVVAPPQETAAPAPTVVAEGTVAAPTPVAAAPAPEKVVEAPKVEKAKAATPPKAAPVKKEAASKPTAKKADGDSARVLYRPPPKSKPKPKPVQAEAPKPPPPPPAPPARAPSDRPRRRVETPRSLEDVLAEERGFVPSQHTAVVVAPAPANPAPSAKRPSRPVAEAPGGSPGAVEGTRTRGRREVGVGAPPSSAGDGRRRRRSRGGTRGRFDREFQSANRRRKSRRGGGKKTQITTPKAIKRVVSVEDNITVGELAHAMSVKSGEVIKSLMKMGVMANVNQSLDVDTASIIAQEFNYEVKDVTFDESAFIPDVEESEEGMIPRAPVVTIMGHVDHGKTTLLDAIRSSDLAGREAGGITQHIGAYKVHTEAGTIVFLDTPGHEAFTAMRARGADVTDIVILVVAADDGVMPQTVEAINHAQEAEVPIIVAVNKIDKPGAQPEVVQRKLAEYNLVPEAWGGDTIFVPVSAKQGDGISDLLEMLLLQAEVLELMANPDRAARATVIEAELDKGRGPVATVLVETGTLRVGDDVVAGQYYGRVRAMFDEHGESLDEAGPSTPVQILGLGGVPDAGELFAAVDDSDIAKSIAEERAGRNRSKELAESTKVSLDDLMAQMQEDTPEEVRLIVKADVQGSLQAVVQAFKGLSTDKVRVNIIQTGVGTISESEVMLAHTSDAVIFGFNVQADTKSQSIAEQNDVQIQTHRIIYEALDELRVIMTSKLPPILQEKVLGHAEVRDTFSIPKIGLIGGCMVLDGKIIRNSMARLLRQGKPVWEGRLTSLKRFKDDAREVEKGFECGIGLDSFNDLQAEDVIESFMIEEIAPTL